MRVLAIETSDRIGTLATLETADGSNSVICSRVLPADQRSARSLVPAIESVLKESTWQPSQLELICVTTGPGSFTGLRIGVTAAKSLAYATGAELVEVHTLSAIAAGVTLPWKRLWAILDAQRRELFVAKFDSDVQGLYTANTETRIVSSEDWFKELRAGDVVSGPPLSKLAKGLPAGIVTADAAEWAPCAEIVGQLGVAAYLGGKTVDVMQLVPNYYRKSAAEEKADAKS